MSELAMYEKKLIYALNCPKPMRERLLERFRGDLREFCAGAPDMPWEQVEDFLGAPDELARTMLEQEDQEELERYRRRKKIVRRVKVGFVAAIFVLCVFGLAGIYITKKAPLNVTVIEYPAVVEEPVVDVN